MKNLDELKGYRKRHPLLGWGDDNGGLFKVQSPVQKDKFLFIIASTGEGWDHVSVSLPHRIPTWTEMNYIKDLFFKEDEVVMQLHPAKKDYISICKNCLHLWRPQNEKIPLPEMEMV